MTRINVVKRISAEPQISLTSAVSFSVNFTFLQGQFT